MLAKILYFSEYDKRSNIQEPLSSIASIDEVSVKRNNTYIILNKYDTLSAAEAAFSSTFAIPGYTNENVYVASLYTDELLSNIIVKYSDKYAKLSKTEFATYIKYTVISEDNSVSYSMYLIKYDLGTASISPTLYSVNTVYNEYTSNTISLNCRIYEPVENVGAIHLYNSYHSVDDTNDSYNVLDFVTNGANIEYLSFAGVDPDDETLADSFDAFTIFGVLGRQFTLLEQSFLDSAFVYISVTKNSITDYYRLVKNQPYDIEPKLTELKKALSDSYVFMSFNIVAPIDQLSAAEVYTLSNLYTANSVIQYLEANSKHYYDISAYTQELIDVSKTNELNTFTNYKLFNTMFDDVADFAITQAEVSNFSKSISTLLLLVLPVEYVSSKTYLSILAETETNEYLKTECVQDDIKTQYLKEIANTSFVSTYLNSRQLRWIISRLEYMTNSDYLYEVDTQNVLRMITGLKAVLDNKLSVYDTEQSIYSFFNLLHTFKFKSNVIQNVSW